MLGVGRKIQKPAILFGVLAVLFGLLAPLILFNQTAHAASSASWAGSSVLQYGGDNYTGPGTFVGSGGKKYTSFKHAGSSTATCGDEKVIYFTSDYHKATSARIVTREKAPGAIGNVCGGYSSPKTISIAKTLASGGGTSSGTSGGGGSGGSAADCDEKDNQCTGIECPGGWHWLNPLNWVMCPLANLMESTADTLDGQINKLLCINTGQIFGKASVCHETTPNKKSSDAFKNAWNVFRIIALGLLAIAGLVMIISQAAGFEIFDAYSIRKILPRLLIAAIGVSLSWQILYFLVELSNVLGTGVRSIIYAPFVQAGIPLNFTLSTTANAAGSVGLLSGLVILGMFGLLSFLATALLAILIAFLVLIFRNLLIYMLVILAPIAIACYVLPNTQKVWKYWWDWFFMGLMAFPIIEAFIAGGRVFAGVTATGDSGGIYSIISFIAYFIPYFLLPFAFRLAGGAMATIGGLVNDRSRGAFDRLKKYRAGQSAQNLQQMRTGSRFGKSKIMQAAGLSSPLDRLTSRATTRNLGLGKEGQAAYEQKMAVASGEFARTAAGQAMQHNDPALAAMTYRNRAEAKANLVRDGFVKTEAEADEAISAVQASGGFGKERQVWAAKQLAATGTGYEDQAQMFSTLSRVADGNKGLATSMWGDARALSERAGRNDMKSGFASGNSLIHQIMDDGRAGASADELHQQYDGGYKGADGKEVDNGFLAQGLEAARGVDGMQMARNKPKSITNITKGFQKSQSHYRAIIADDTGRFNQEQKDHASEALGQIQAQYENFERSAAYGPEVNAGIANSEANKAAQQAIQTHIDRQGDTVAEQARTRESLSGGIEARAADQALRDAQAANQPPDDGPQE